MASVDDVYDKVSEVSARIAQLELTATDLLDVSRDTLTAIRDGFNTVSAEIQTTNAINTRISAQTATVICLLEKIAKIDCDSLNELHWQTDLERIENQTLDQLRRLTEGAYPAAALETRRETELEAQIQACCPPPEPVPICTVERCPDPGPYQAPVIK